MNIFNTRLENGSFDVLKQGIRRWGDLFHILIDSKDQFSSIIDCLSINLLRIQPHNKFFEILKFRAVAVDIGEWILGKMLKHWRDHIAAHPCLPCRLFSFSFKSRCGVWTSKSMKEWHATWFWFPQWLAQCVHMDISDILSWSKLDPNFKSGKLAFKLWNLPRQITTTSVSTVLSIILFFPSSSAGAWL